MVRVEEPPVTQESKIPPQVVSTWSGSAREQAVQRMFTSIARCYDLNNTLLSFGLHYRWKKVAASFITPVEQGTALDVGSDTGINVQALPSSRRSNTALGTASTT
jgi:demethylmenaquinone methyltransferase/2-methoxy-6-polyprenyl-1,4-benzoquinol methylase